MIVNSQIKRTWVVFFGSLLCLSFEGCRSNDVSEDAPQKQSTSSGGEIESAHLSASLPQIAFHRDPFTAECIGRRVRSYGSTAVRNVFTFDGTDRFVSRTIGIEGQDVGSIREEFLWDGNKVNRWFDRQQEAEITIGNDAPVDIVSSNQASSPVQKLIGYYPPLLVDEEWLVHAISDGLVEYLGEELWLGRKVLVVRTTQPGTRVPREAKVWIDATVGNKVKVEIRENNELANEWYCEDINYQPKIDASTFRWTHDLTKSSSGSLIDVQRWNEKSHELEALVGREMVEYTPKGVTLGDGYVVTHSKLPSSENDSILNGWAIVRKAKIDEVPLGIFIIAQEDERIGLAERLDMIQIAKNLGIELYDPLWLFWDGNAPGPGTVHRVLVVDSDWSGSIPDYAPEVEMAPPAYPGR